MIDIFDMHLPGDDRRVRDISDKDEADRIITALYYNVGELRSDLDYAYLAQEKEGEQIDAQWLADTKAELRNTHSVLNAMKLQAKQLKKAGKNEHERRRQAILIDCLRSFLTEEQWLLAIETFRSRFAAEIGTSE